MFSRPISTCDLIYYISFNFLHVKLAISGILSKDFIRLNDGVTRRSETLGKTHVYTFSQAMSNAWQNNKNRTVSVLALVTEFTRYVYHIFSKGGDSVKKGQWKCYSHFWRLDVDLVKVKTFIEYVSSVWLK